MLVSFPAVLVSWLLGLRWVAGQVGGLRLAAGGWLSCVFIRCWVMAFVGGLWCGVVALGGAGLRVVVWCLSVVWGPVSAGRLLCVRCAAMAAIVPWLRIVELCPVLVRRPGRCAACGQDGAVGSVRVLWLG